MAAGSCNSFAVVLTQLCETSTSSSTTTLSVLFLYSSTPGSGSTLASKPMSETLEGGSSIDFIDSEASLMLQCNYKINRTIRASCNYSVLHTYTNVRM